MKRNFDTLRDLLLVCEAQPDEVFWVSDVDADEDGVHFGWSDPIKDAHFRLLEEAGLVAKEFASQTDENPRKFGFRITWSGYDFLETVRDGEVWNKSKIGLAALGGASLTVLTSIATGYAMEKAALLGLPMR